MVISGSEKISPARQKSYGSSLMCAAVERRNDHDEDPDRGDDAGLGRREPAGEDAAEQDERDHQRQRRVLERARDVAKRRARTPHARRPEEIAVDHQPEADHEAGHDAGHEQAGDRDVADGAVDHRRDARRHQRRDRRRGGDDRRGERRGVALLLHRPAERAADHRDVGRRRAGHLREEHAEHGDDLRQAAANVADQRQRQIGDPAHDVGRAHQLADQQEERNREQRLGIHAVEDLLDDRRETSRR